MRQAIGIGFSRETDSLRATELALQQAVKSSGPPVFTFLFCTDQYDAGEVFKAFKNTIPRSKMLGATVPGIIIGNNIFREGVGALTIFSPDIEVATHLQEGIGRNSFESGQKAALEIKKQGVDAGTVFLLPDGLAANISGLLRGFYDLSEDSYSYAGGGAGDNLKFYKAYQFTEDGFAADALAVALIKGLEFRVESGHGWNSIGESMMATRAEGKRLYELDGIPAFRKYSEILGGINKQDFSYYGMKHPLGIPSRKGETLIRDPLSVNEDDSIVMVSEIPSNTMVMLMRGETPSLISTAEEIARRASTGKSASFALLFDCVSRYLLMDSYFIQELEAVRGQLCPETPLFGILSFGEVINRTGSPLFDNKSLVLAVGGA